MDHPRLHIGMHAPNFTATTTFGQITLSDYQGSWLVFFSHPGDFTPVCTTEFLAFAQAAENFLKLDTQLLGLSVDSNPSHLGWVQSIYITTGIHIPFPVVADRIGEIARLYGMMPEGDETTTVRNVYIIDPDQIIRAILIYPKTNGRNIEEILRLIAALQFSDREGLVTPVNWMPGQPGMITPPSTYQELLSRANELESLNANDWYWAYKQEKPYIIQP